MAAKVALPRMAVGDRPNPRDSEAFSKRLEADIALVRKAKLLVRDFCTCCDGPIFLPDRATIAAQRPYHTDHVRCTKCNQVILESYYPETNASGRQDLYCPQCYVDLKADKCIRCGKSITGQMVTVEEKSHFHPTCFTCQGLEGQTCANSLLDGYHRQEDRMICAPCYKRSKLPKCFKCKGLIEPENDKGSEYVVLNGQNLHVACFTCHQCGTGLHQQQAYLWDREAPSYVCNACCKKLGKRPKEDGDDKAK